MPGATTTYGPEAVSNVTTHPFGGGGGTIALLPLILSMALRRRVPGGIAPTSRERMGFAPRGRAPYIPAREPAFGGQDPREAEAQRFALMQIAQRAMAAGGPPPTRMLAGPGITPGYTMDPLAMNAYQRELFLPQSATAGMRRERSRGYDPRSGGYTESESAAGLF